MKKKLSLTILFLIPVIASAHLHTSSAPNPDQFKGLPLPGSGVQIVPISQMRMSDTGRKQALQNLEQLKTKGYVEQKIMRPNQLLYLGYGGKITVDDQGTDPQDTRLKKNLSQVKLAFPFKGVPSIEPQNIIGFAVSGMWKNGWTGVRELFNKENLGTCDFTLFNLALSEGGKLISAEHVRYDVNNKPTLFNVAGSKNSGFLYTIEWADNTYSYNLECANENFDSKVTQNLIKLAQSIDQTVMGN